jgi:hypothetical protein
MTSTSSVLSDTPAPQAPETGYRPAALGRRLAAAALVVGAGGNTAQAVLGQLLGERPDAVAEQIVMANDHPVHVTAMCLAGTVAVPFMALGFVAAAQVLRARAARTGLVAGVLLVLGMWGFLAVQTAELIQLTAMLDPKGAAAATYLHGMDSQPVLGILFGVPFMLGTVLGMLTLTIGLLVKGGVPRWIPGAWLAFIVLDFSIGSVGPVDPHWLYLAGAVGLAAHLLRGRDDASANA